jgi:hypothetical protein
MASTGAAFGSMAGVRTTIKTVPATPVTHATPRNPRSDHDHVTLPRPCRSPKALIALAMLNLGGHKPVLPDRK